MSALERINLTNLKRCDQAWENMTPVERGRLCQKCNHTIIDFRKMTNREVAEVHTFTDEKVCGIYREDQLKLDISQTRVPRPQMWKSVSLGLLGLFFIESAEAQDLNPSEKTEQLEKNPALNVQSSEDRVESRDTIPKQDSLIVRGRLYDPMKQPAPFANVYVNGTKYGVSSDIDGYYSINLTEHFDSTGQLTLVYKYIGYIPNRIVVNKNNIKDIDIVFDYGEIIEFSVPIKQPLHKRIGNGFRGLFRKNE